MAIGGPTGLPELRETPGFLDRAANRAGRDDRCGWLDTVWFGHAGTWVSTPRLGGHLAHGLVCSRPHWDAATE